MAMNNSYYGGHPPSSSFSPPFSAPHSSTPSNPRLQAPRFAYSGPPFYPRPRSSASKPNPDSSFSDVMRSRYTPSDNFDDSMMNNYGNSELHMDVSSYPSDNESFIDQSGSFHSQNNTDYYSCNESFYEPAKESIHPTNTISHGYSGSLLVNEPFGFNSGPGPKYPYQQNPFEANFSPKTGANKPRKFNKKKLPKGKNPMASKSEWKCTVCDIEFTSSIPYDMHLRGAKHAKKLKGKDALQSIELQVAKSRDIATVGKTFRCDLCGLVLNSSLQLQTHLDGIKHKNKLLQQQQLKERQDKAGTGASQTDDVNGKSNGSTIRPLPADFGEPRPTKITKFSCDICSISVNSDVQLSQHLVGKYHLAKVEGKPVSKKRFMKTKSEDETSTEQPKTAAMEISKVAGIVGSKETPKTVLGVKTLTSSFVHGETMK